MTYDATASLNYTYDQENRITGAAGYAYTYDGDGNRVRKSNGNLAANGALYWAMTPGVVAETDLAGTTKSEYIFFDGERVARRDGATGTGGIFYYFSDNLKTASIITDSAGVIKAESDYYPWGGELQFVNNDSNDYKFTGKKRDAETGIDYFGARYYSSAMGRFLSPDWSAKEEPVPYAKLDDPQSLNLYAYVENNPLARDDLDGHAFGLDDLVGAVAGAAVGALVEVGKDLLTGQKITTGAVVGAAAGGALFGEGVVNAPETLGGSVVAAAALKGAVQGAVSNAVQQGVDIATGEQKNFNGKSFAVSTVAGAVTAGIASKVPLTKIPGMSAGKGNMKAVAQAVRTKIASRIVSQMSLKTVVKGAIGGQVATSGKTLTEAAADLAVNKTCNAIVLGGCK